MRITELVDPRGRVWRVEIPATRRERMRGLRDRGFLPPDHAMLFPRCRSVHTFGMRFPITVAFLDARWRIVAIRSMRPGHIARPRVRARSVLECPAETDLRPGDVLGPTAGARVDPASGNRR